MNTYNILDIRYPYFLEDDDIHINIDKYLEEIYHKFNFTPLIEGAPMPPDPSLAPPMPGGMPPPPMGAPMPPPPGIPPMGMPMGPAPGMVPPPQIGPMVDPGTGLQIPSKIDPVLGIEIPRGSTVGNPTALAATPPILLKDIDKISELKKIHTHLINLQNLLESQSGPEYEKIAKILTNSIEYFYNIIKNLDSFTNFLDDIIIKYKKFIYILVKELTMTKKILDKIDEDKIDEKSSKDISEEDEDNNNDVSELSDQDVIDYFSQRDEDDDVNGDSDDYLVRTMRKIMGIDLNKKGGPKDNE